MVFIKKIKQLSEQFNLPHRTVEAVLESDFVFYCLIKKANAALVKDIYPSLSNFYKAKKGRTFKLTKLQQWRLMKKNYRPRYWVLQEYTNN
jgi:hypothetical protein